MIQCLLHLKVSQKKGEKSEKISISNPSQRGKLLSSTECNMSARNKTHNFEDQTNIQVGAERQPWSHDLGESNGQMTKNLFSSQRVNNQKQKCRKMSYIELLMRTIRLTRVGTGGFKH